ncbi:hypothetical protein DFJ73DRAFT_844470 [Zopfochytrium polystomum]|nr:hypothetical protein DFJ73DRAFT_844470 [Zopfochytrium polystomum]
MPLEASAVAPSPSSQAAFERHWRAFALAAAAAAVVGGLSYLVYSSKVSSSSGPGSATSSTSDKAVAAAKAKKPKKPTTSKAAPTPASAGDPVPTEKPDAEEELLTRKIELLSAEEKISLAKESKTVGNRLFGEKKYADAVKYYSRAIELNPDAIYYANRAACYANLGKNEEVISDCTKALDMDPRYVKAIYRRAQAYASTAQLEDALKDYTAICMLEEFKKESSIAMTDRILKDIGKAKTDELMKVKTPRLPSDTFVKAYMDSFRPSFNGADVVAAMQDVTQGDAAVKKAFALLPSHEWAKSMAAVGEALKLKLSRPFEIHGLNLAGTFAFLRGDVNGAAELFERALELDPKNVNICIKRASIFMERGDLESAVREYQRAEGLNPKDPDVYYHRGQIRFLTGDLDSAVSDYRKSLSLDDNFVYAHIQLGVALYKEGKKGESSAVFAKAEKKFPTSPEVSNYYGEILLDQESYADALKSFDKAISMNPKSPLPYINKAILYLQWQKDIDMAESLCRKAIEVDPLCDIAFIQLSQLLIQQNRLDEALACYDEAIGVTRTEPELMNAVSCREVGWSLQTFLSYQCFFTQGLRGTGELTLEGEIMPITVWQIYVSKLYPDIFAKLRAAGGL